jgi:hypothetical protein
MIIPPTHEALLRDPMFSFWIGTASPENVPEVIKCMGVNLDYESERLACFAAVRFADKSLDNLQKNPAISLVGAHVGTYQGYQYKGTFIRSRPCTANEVEFQRQYMEDFALTLNGFGYSKEGLYRLYFSQPSLAIEFKVHEVFDQAPRQGTGEKIGI